MATIDPKTVLWANIQRYMGGDSVTIEAVQRRTGVGRGTIGRIKQGDTSIGTDVLFAIAEALKVEVWQLLVPHSGNKTPPTTLAGALEVLATALHEADEPTRDLVAGMLGGLARNPENHAKVALGLTAMLQEGSQR
jgi:transcriptional regulator with XRE-family HTH domain